MRTSLTSYSSKCIDYICLSKTRKKIGQNNIIIIFKKMINKNYNAYKIGRGIRRLGLFLTGYICGKRWGRRPIDDFSKK